MKNRIYGALLVVFGVVALSIPWGGGEGYLSCLSGAESDIRDYTG